jgi:hypothetical protein
VSTQRAPSSRPVSIGGLLRGAFDLYRANLRLVLSVTVPIVGVVTVLTAVGLGELGSRYTAKTQFRDAYVNLAALQLVTIPLVSAILARFVVAKRRGEGLGFAELLSGALDVFPWALLAVVAWLAVVFVGLATLIFPGIYVAVSWYFVVQAVVIEGDRGLKPIARSAAVVRGRWWQSAFVGLAFQLTVAAAQALIVVVFTQFAQAADSNAVLVLGVAVGSAATLPFVAIGATQYYLLLRDSAVAGPRRF